MKLTQGQEMLLANVKRAYGADKGGWWHAERLSQMARGQSEWRVALCHDLIEDNYATYTQLAQWGLSAAEAYAVNLLTRLEHMTYSDYIDSILRAYERGDDGADLAIRVKYIDLCDHIRPDRVGNISLSHVKRYTSAIVKLAPYLCKEG